MNKLIFGIGGAYPLNSTCKGIQRRLGKKTHGKKIRAFD